MPKEFKLPDMGEGIKSGDIVQVLVAEGDTIKGEQAVVEVETDKAVLEVPCPFGGKVSKIHVKPGDKVSVGATLLTVETDAAGAPSAPAKASPAPAAAPPPAKAAPAPAAAKTQPATSPPPPQKPQPAAKPAPATVTTPVAPVAATAKSDEAPVAAGPATRRLARELGVDLQSVAQLNPGVRLTEEHVKAYVRDNGRGGGGAPAAATHAGPLPDFSQWGQIERVPLSSLQRKTAEHLAAAWITIPHVTQFESVDVTALEGLRQRFRHSGRGKEVKLTVTAFVIKAAAIALKEFPQFNCSLDVPNNQMIHKKYYHIGVAVDTEAGLIVPVLRDVDQKRVLDISQELNDIAEKTRQRKIGLDELRGGTFTITNLGSIGGTAFTPIVNYPEVAILGLARSREEPALRDGKLINRLMLPLCLSYDHRVINGADGARFIRKLATLLEDPEMLLLEG